MENNWPNYWKDRWDKGNTGFHQDDFEPFLLKYFPKLSPSSVFVPLCGKSRDMVWLAQQGHHVTGIELSSIACEAFFQENHPGTYQKKAEGDFISYQGGNFTLYCGDFFKLTREHLNKIAAIYDRAALIALPPDLRKKYVSHLCSLISNRPNPLQLLLMTLEYPQEKVPGPPFSVPDAEVAALYEGTFQITRLFHEVDPVFSQNSANFKELQVYESVYLMKTK